MKKLQIAAVILAMASPAAAQNVPAPIPAPAPAAPAKVLTVSDVIGIANAIGQLDAHPTGNTDRLGNALTAPNNFHFNGITLMTLGRDLERGRDIYNAYTAATSKLVAEIDSERQALPKGTPQDKINDFTNEKNAALNAEQQKMLATSAVVNLDHIKFTDLCLEAKPPECPIANEIPISILSLLDPIIDK